MASCESSTEQGGFSGGRDVIEMLSAPSQECVHRVHSGRPRDLKRQSGSEVDQLRSSAEAINAYLTASRSSEYQEAVRDTRSDTFSSLRWWTSSLLPLLGMGEHL